MSEHSWPVAPAPAFSNGTEWEIWRSKWCNSCKEDTNEDCPIVVDVLCHEERNELRRQDLTIVCTAWKQR